MQLRTVEWGEGRRVAVLLHGMLGAGEQFWRVGPALAERGYRAVAVDLPGHGGSPAAPDADLGMFAASVVETVGCEPELAIGHSLGGVVLAEALPVLRPARAVYVDIPLADDGAQRTADELTSGFMTARAGRTVEALRISKPAWSEKDREVEASAAERFDVATAVALELAHGASQPPTAEIPSLVVRAEPSRYVSKARAAELAALGFEVRSVPGAGHSIWYGHFSEFMAALEGWI
ncbi:alpha/beta fold hydrolase [Kribbella sp. NBC_00889]|uniref:alpha/beta fold hydrolase n=1 Tax=Kribbella sp. NBC_00889 TaxID=2975974 RepID=UPI0038680700|nr:alpha/beta hydrolase [Kribbella sp. NBC_00889]